MRRTVSALIEASLAHSANLVFSIAVARDVPTANERLTVSVDGRDAQVRELVAEHGTRLHVLDVPEGRVRMEYRAEIEGSAEPAPVTELDRIVYTRPSRYCESDVLQPTAVAEFAGLSGKSLLDGVSSWVGERLSYVPGSSLPTHSALDTLLARRGVCRDYAHLVVALLRALDVPARMVSVYAPGLAPMDFHAVAEAEIDGVWCVVDATALAPRLSLVRIATGRDAADTAFLTNHGAGLTLDVLEVGAVVDRLPVDDVRALAQIR